jgi:adenosylhomocysteine nucleosidase
MSKVLLAFAMKEEFAPWRRRHHFRPETRTGRTLFSTSFGFTEILVGLTGTGAPSAGQFDDLVAQCAPDFAIITGVAAGIKPEWRSGDLLAAQTVLGPGGQPAISLDPNLIDLAVQCGAKRAPALITLPCIARTVKEKTRWSETADAADMESLNLIKLWSARDIPSLAVRVILDPAEMPMRCDFEAALDPQGQVRISQIIMQLARQPRLLPDFLRLARMSHRALRILAGFWDRFFGLADLGIN